MRPRTIVLIILVLIVLFSAHHPVGQAIVSICKQFVKFGNFIESGKFSLK